MMKLKWSRLTLLALAMILLFSSSVFAFEDIKGSPGEESIRALERMGIVSGVAEGRFHPKGEVTYAQGVHMLVKAFDLNINHLKFIKEPKASDYFTTIPDNAWFADSFMVAQLNGIPLAKDVDPYKALTREEFAHLLMSAVMLKGDYAFIEIFLILNDEKDVNPDYMNSIQKLLIAKIAQLDDKRNFYPKQALTRAEAAEWLHKAMKFVKDSVIKPGDPKPQPQDPPQQEKDVQMIVDKVNDEINKVTVSWGTKPNPGYRISIKEIEFQDEEAIIRYELQYPEKDGMYIQVVTEPKAETYVSSKYKVSLQPAGDSQSGRQGSGASASVSAE